MHMGSYMHACTHARTHARTHTHAHPSVARRRIGAAFGRNEGSSDDVIGSNRESRPKGCGSSQCAEKSMGILAFLVER